MRAGLGTKLRHLLDLLDGDVERLYRELGVDFRPRYYPVFRALLDEGAGTIRAIEAHSGLTHSALSQTIAGLRRAGLVTAKRGDDGRERWIHLTDKRRRLAVRLQP